MMPYTDFYTRLAGALLVLFLLTACQSQPGRQNAPVVDERIGEDSLIQVVPLTPPAIQSILTQAESAWVDGRSQQAQKLLLRALALQPDSPLVMRKLAEFHLAQGQYTEALTWARKAALSGPPVGQWCAQSWQVAALAAEQLGQHQQQAAALQAMDKCRLRAAPRY